MSWKPIDGGAIYVPHGMRLAALQMRVVMHYL